MLVESAFDLKPPEIIVGAIVVRIITDVTGFSSNFLRTLDWKKVKLEIKQVEVAKENVIFKIPKKLTKK